MRLRRLGLVSVSMLAACAAGQVAPVAVPSGFTLHVPGEGEIAIAVRDQREDVLSGHRKESLYGHQRSLYGIPYPVNTASGHPFASDLANQVASALRAGGATVKVVPASAFKPEDRTIDALVATGASRLLLFTIKEWDADRYSTITLHYDISLDVFGHDGHKITESAVKGEDDLKPAGRPERRSLPAATADLLNTLLSDKQVAAALKGELHPAEAHCTTDQIIKMRDSGLSDQQIEAACGPGGSGR